MYAYTPEVFKTYLTGRLPADVRVATSVPIKMPAKLVVIRSVQTGAGLKPEQLSWRRLMIRVYHGDDELAAGELAELVCALILSSRRAGIGVRKVLVIGTPGLFPDKDDGLPSFQMTIDVLMRAIRATTTTTE